jgi:hypothetical protein
MLSLLASFDGEARALFSLGVMHNAMVDINELENCPRSIVCGMF